MNLSEAARFISELESHVANGDLYMADSPHGKYPRNYQQPLEDSAPLARRALAEAMRRLKLAEQALEGIYKYPEEGNALLTSRRAIEAIRSDADV